MRHGMERDCGLHRRHDGEPEWRKLCRQLLDAEPESGDQQRRSWQRRTLDCDGSLFDLLDRAGRSDWIGGFGHDSIQHEPELEHGHSTRGMQCQLQGPAERNFDRIPNHNVRCRDWSHAFDNLQLYV